MLLIEIFPSFTGGGPCSLWLTIENKGTILLWDHWHRRTFSCCFVLINLIVHQGGRFILLCRHWIREASSCCNISLTLNSIAFVSMFTSRVAMCTLWRASNCLNSFCFRSTCSLVREKPLFFTASNLPGLKQDSIICSPTLVLSSLGVGDTDKAILYNHLISILLILLIKEITFLYLNFSCSR